MDSKIMNNRKGIERYQQNLSKNMLWYTLIVMVAGILTGYFFPEAKQLSKFILPTVFIMIYPMMVSISLQNLKKMRGSVKPLYMSLILNFIYAPIMFYLLSKIFISDPLITLGLMLLSVAPASSMGLGYLGISEGHMVSGAIIVTIEFILAIILYPIFGVWFASNASINIAPNLILKNLLYVLIIPLILGVGTREYIEHKANAPQVYKKKFKPYFGSITLTALYFLMFSIFASKASLIVKNYMTILMIAPVALLFYGISLFIFPFINRDIVKMDYGKHQAVVFTSVSKNVALSIAILVSVFGVQGQYIAIAPAIMSLFQAPSLMLYLKTKDKVHELFLRKNNTEIKGVVSPTN